MRLLRRPPHRVAVPEPHAVPLVDEVEMRVDLHEMDRTMLREGGDAGDVDRMVAAEHHRERARREDLAHAVGDVGVAAHRVRVDDVRIAEIDDPRLRGRDR